MIRHETTSLAVQRARGDGFCARKMLTPKLVSWHLLLVITIWLCAVLVRSGRGDSTVLFATKPSLSSIDGARAFSSLFGRGIPSASISHYPPPSKTQHILTAGPSDADRNELYASPVPAALGTVRKISNTLFALLPTTVKQTQTSLVRNLPQILSLETATLLLIRTPRNIINKLMSMSGGGVPTPAQPDPQQCENVGISPLHPIYHSLSTCPALDADDDKSCARIAEICTAHDDNASNTPLSALLSKGLTDNRHPTGLLPNCCSKNSQITSGLPSGRTKAQGSCLGLLIGMVVAIVWL